MSSDWQNALVQTMTNAVGRASQPVRGGWIMLLLLMSLTSLTGCQQSAPPPPSAIPVASSTATPSASSPTESVASASAESKRSETKAAPRPTDPQLADQKVRPRTMRRAGGVLDLTFDDLEFDIEADEDFLPEMLGENIRALDGKSVILRGFILGASVFQQQGFDEFVLIRDNQQCCFGPGAKIYHNVMVEMEDGKTADFSFRPVQVAGVLSIRPWVNPGDGKTYSVFHLAATSVK